jgi:hypothetical protein
MITNPTNSPGLLDRIFPTPEIAGIAFGTVVAAQQALALFGVDGYVTSANQIYVPVLATASAFATGYFAKKSFPHFKITSAQWTNQMKDDVIHLLGSLMICGVCEFCSVIVISNNLH